MSMCEYVCVYGATAGEAAQLCAEALDLEARHNGRTTISDNWSVANSAFLVRIVERPAGIRLPGECEVLVSVRHCDGAPAIHEPTDRIVDAIVERTAWGVEADSDFPDYVDRVHRR